MPQSRTSTKTFPWGTLALQKDTILLVMGGAVSSRGTLWCADYHTGERCEPPIASLETVPATEQPSLENNLRLVREWARAGNADAMWFLGSIYHHNNHPASVWYYLAAMRRDQKAYGWQHPEIRHHALRPDCAVGRQAPDVAFAQAIPEFTPGNRSWGDWTEAVDEAERAALEVKPAGIDSAQEVPLQIDQDSRSAESA